MRIPGLIKDAAGVLMVAIILAGIELAVVWAVLLSQAPKSPETAIALKSPVTPSNARNPQYAHKPIHTPDR